MERIVVVHGFGHDSYFSIFLHGMRDLQVGVQNNGLVLGSGAFFDVAFFGTAAHLDRGLICAPQDGGVIYPPARAGR